MATRKMAFGGMGGKMADRAKAAAGKAAEAGKAKEAQKSAMADKMKSAAKDFMAKKSAEPAPYTEAHRQMADKAYQAKQAKQADMASKVQSQRDSAAKAQQAKQSAMADRMKAAPKPAMPARPVARPAPQTNGMYKPPEIRGASGSMGARPTSTARPAMTPQVKQGLLDMSNKLRGMPMKKGGKAKGKK